MKPVKQPGPGDRVQIIPCPTCHESVGAFSGGYFSFDEPGWAMHEHQPAKEECKPRFQDIKGQSRPLERRDFEC